MESKTIPLKPAILSFGISILLLICKFTAYYITDSMAVLSDAMESIINVATGSFLLYAVSASNQPADECHPYGHGKVESFSAGLEGGLILIAGIVIFIEAVPAFFTAPILKKLDIGIIILLAAGIANLVLGQYLIASGKKAGSDALVANGKHLLTDFYTSGGVFLGLIAVRFTGLQWLDPAIACLVALNILIPGIKLIRKSVKDLMNAADQKVLSRVTSALNSIADKNLLCPHRVRVIRSGQYYHIDLHISLPRFWSLEKAHATEKKVARALLDELGTEGDVMVHLDPCEPTCCACCNHENCPERQDEFKRQHRISLENVILDKPICKINK